MYLNDKCVCNKRSLIVKPSSIYICIVKSTNIAVRIKDTNGRHKKIDLYSHLLISLLQKKGQKISRFLKPLCGWHIVRRVPAAATNLLICEPGALQVLKKGRSHLNLSFPTEFTYFDCALA